MRHIQELSRGSLVLLACLLALGGCSRRNTEVPQVETSKAPWRTDPDFAGMFHADFPDDLQVILHEGGPRITEARPELVWVRVVEKQSEAYRGLLLNQPQQLPSYKEGDAILFRATNAGNSPVAVTTQYLRERSAWEITPCDKCGMPELFDPPSDLITRIFPDMPADGEMEMFSTFCPLCGGVQIVTKEEM